MIALTAFLWTEYQTGRLPELLATARSAGEPGPVATPVAIARRAVAPTPTEAPSATSAPATPTATVPPRPTSTPTSAPERAAPPTPVVRGPSTVSISGSELDGELKRQVAAGGIPLRNPSVALVPPDRVQLRGDMPVAIFSVPVEIEARLLVDDRGALRLSTTRVDAVGSSLPAGVSSALGQQIDDQGSQAVQAALPPGATARRVSVESDRVTVELAQ